MVAIGVAPGHMDGQVAAYAASGAAAPRSDAEREQMILRYAPLVRYVVGRLVVVLPQVFDFEDLLGYGTIGLIEAVDRYDAARGVTFESFAGERIRGSIIDALRAADWVPRTARKRAKDIQQAFAQLEEEMGRPPTDAEVAEHLSLTIAQLHRATADAACTVTSLQRPMHALDEDGTPSTLMDYIADESAGPGHGIEERELRRSVAQALGRLDERERQVLSLYYERSLTLREISEVLDVSESRVWQLHARAITRLRAYMDDDTRQQQKQQKGAA